MLNIGLTAAQREDYHNLCMTHHRRVILVYLTDTNQNILSVISNRLADGQVDIDRSAEVSRKLSCTIWDPDYQLGLDNANINMGALFADRQLYVVYQVWAPDWSHGYGAPIFRGPITKVNRIGNFLSLEGSGKEYLLYSSSWWKRTYKKGLLRHEVVRRLLLDSGERLENYYVPDSKYHLVKDIAISYDSPTWPVIESEATAMQRMAFYDADGDAIVRPTSNASVYTFRKFCSEPEINFNTDNLTNSALVIGAIPKGKKSHLTKRFVAPASHPMNPYNIGRIGYDGKKRGRFYTKVVSDNTLTTLSEVIKVGNKVVADGLLQATEASFSAPVLPDLEETDVFGVVHEGASTTTRFSKATIPLTGPPISTYGYLRKVAPNKAVIRRQK